MDPTTLRRLTGMIAARLWLVAVLAAALGGLLVWLGVRFGLALATIAVLVAPIAVVTTFARLLRQPANRVPRWLAALGAVGSVGGLLWVLLSPGDPPAIITFAVGVWLLVAGLVASVLVSPRSGGGNF